VLRILLDDVKSQRVVLVLHGQMVEDLADSLERGCAELRKTGLAVVLLLSGVAFIGRKGVEVLRRLTRAGVRIIGSAPLSADSIEEEWIDVDPPIGDMNSGSCPGQDGDA
jgi:predicted nuclease with RNAse H fold